MQAAHRARDCRCCGGSRAALRSAVSLRRSSLAARLMPSLRVPLQELSLKFTLPSGQSFRWRKRAPSPDHKWDVWVGVIGQNVVSLTQDEKAGLLHYDFLNRDFSTTSASGDRKRVKRGDEEAVIRDYFQLDTSLRDLYQEWRERDARFCSVADRFPGVRVLRQDPVENLFSFICSSCNNIKRISLMIEKMCRRYGRLLMHDEELGDMFSFPSTQSLADPDVERVLRSEGFGYRAAFIQKAAEMICREGMQLDSLRERTHEEARSELMRLPGVGRKVADCISLFSLDHCGSIPVDTHVYQIASRHYLKHLSPAKKGGVTEKTYKEVCARLQQLFGSHAGWAHSVLFTADLPLFRETPSPPD